VLGARTQDVHTLATERDRGFLPSIAAVRDALEQGVELLYLESPSRFTGATYESAAVDRIAGLLREHDAGAIWDQGQAVWVPDGSYTSLASVDGTTGRTALLGEAWPGKGLESWFAGYVGTANEDWFDPMESQKQVMSICTSTPTQYAAHAIGTQFSETHPAHRKSLSESRAEAVAVANDIGVRPLPGDAANLVALPLSAARRDRLDDAGIDFADGTAFGAPEAVRLSVTTDGSTIDAVSDLE
jgi:aspartate/methionine/tyrosine aminotransferase